MSKFYTNVFIRGNRIYMRGYEMGLRVKETVDYEPYLFVESNRGEYKTLDGIKLAKKQFRNIISAREFIRGNSADNPENAVNKQLTTIYGLTTFQYLYIYDTFKGDIDYDPSMIKVGIIDIECAADEGFPSIENADKPITAITIRCRNRNYVFGCGYFETEDPNTHYFKCSNEIELISQFAKCFRALDLDILTGWNIEWFDIPYIINRMKSLGLNYKKLSPYNMVDEKIIEFKSKSSQSYIIQGITTLDYLHLYRKFTFGNQESYKLDFIAEVELNQKKLDYSEYGNLLELYKNNFQKFIEYNIHDTVLVDRIDDKMKFIEQVMALAYDAKVNYLDTMTTVRPWDIIIHNYLLDKGIVVPPVKKQSMTEALVGGYVKDPKIGMSEWVVSFDLNSLYPHLIMQYNISPETFVTRNHRWPSIDELLDGKRPAENEYATAANGCMYRRDSQGFLPALMERMYDDRTKYKNLMIDAKKRYEKNKNAEDAKLVARYHNLQLAKKIQLNSAYGALGNQYFRWFNFDHAEAITTSGQLSIRWIERKINEFMNKTLKSKKDYIIASDTDSIYVDMSGLVKHIDVKEDIKIVSALDQFCEQKVQPYIDRCYQELADYMNAYQQKMKMKRETIANKGIWRGKKMYILNAWNVEGVQYDKPKLKIHGIEAVRSSTPRACREKIKDGLSIIMNGDVEQFVSFVGQFRSDFETMPFQDIAFPRSLNKLYKYSSKSSIYKKSTPIQVKGALIYNFLINKHGMKNVPYLMDGDKIRFAYLKTPNPIFESVIAAPDELPSEFNLDKYIDRDSQFEKSFMEPMRSITDVIDWNIDKKATLEDFFS